MTFAASRSCFAALRVRRIVTRYDKLAANFLSGVALATAAAFRL